MRYLMRQKLLAVGDDFSITDESGQRRYYVDGKVFAIRDKATFHDVQGNELLQIEQKLLAIGKTYQILREGRRVATVKKRKFRLFREVFDIEDAAAGDLDAKGDFLDHEYQFTRDGRPIATVSKRYFSLTDTYGVDVIEGEDHVLILACAVVIDMCSHDD